MSITKDQLNARTKGHKPVTDFTKSFYGKGGNSNAAGFVKGMEFIIPTDYKDENKGILLEDSQFNDTPYLKLDAKLSGKTVGLQIYLNSLSRGSEEVKPRTGGNFDPVLDKDGNPVQHYNDGTAMEAFFSGSEENFYDHLDKMAGKKIVVKEQSPMFWTYNQFSGNTQRRRTFTLDFVEK